MNELFVRIIRFKSISTVSPLTKNKIMKSQFLKTTLLLSALCIGTTMFAQTPGSSPGSPTEAGSENVNPRHATPGGPGGPGYDPPGIDVGRTGTPVPAASTPSNTTVPAGVKKTQDIDDTQLIGGDEGTASKNLKRKSDNTSIRKDIKMTKKEDKEEAHPKVKTTTK
jgi:hypothetical protein